MKGASAGLATHLAGELTTLATCWKITRRDGQVLGFTTHVQDLAVSGVTYLSAIGSYTATAIRTSSDMAVDNLDVDAVFDSASLSEVDLRAGKYDFAQVEIFQVNYADLTQGVLKLRRGWLGEVASHGHYFKAELRGLMQALQQTIGRVYGKRCDADLGDTRCTVSLPGITIASAVTSVASRQQFDGSAIPGRRGGLLTWTSGANSGFKMEVHSVNVNTIVLVLPMGYDIAIGDAYSVYPGCDKLLSTCKTVFSNVVNFRGFPNIPGPDKAMRYPDAK